jgi:hypothetical protein
MSLSGTFRFKLHKGRTIKGPWAEDDENYLMLGIDWDLDRAMRLATVNVVDFLVKEKGFTASKAYSFASLSVDFHASEVVDGTQVVTGHGHAAGVGSDGGTGLTRRSGVSGCAPGALPVRPRAPARPGCGVRCGAAAGARWDRWPAASSPR